MKKLLFILCLGILTTQCKEKENTNLQEHQQHFTMEQVKQIAAGYEMSDLVTEEKNAGLVYLTREELDNFLKKEKFNRDLQQQKKQYLQMTADIHSFDDYIKTLDMLPAFKSELVAQKGGEAQYQEWVNQGRQVKWHIYRDTNGVLSWVDPKYGDVVGEGIRVDNNR